LTKRKLRQLELRAGAGKHSAEAKRVWSANSAMREAERELGRRGGH